VEKIVLDFGSQQAVVESLDALPESHSTDLERVLRHGWTDRILTPRLDSHGPDTLRIWSSRAASRCGKGIANGVISMIEGIRCQPSRFRR
jgi:hypothetical protein